MNYRITQEIEGKEYLVEVKFDIEKPGFMTIHAIYERVSEQARKPIYDMLVGDLRESLKQKALDTCFNVGVLALCDKSPEQGYNAA